MNALVLSYGPGDVARPLRVGEEVELAVALERRDPMAAQRVAADRHGSNSIIT
jgi:hypothetical protein